MIITIIKWVMILLFAAFGFLMMMWAVQNAWLSATPIANPEIYATRAVFLFPMSIIIWMLTLILSFVWPKRS